MIATLFVSVAYPFSLLCASVIRASVVSFVYFILFLVTILLSPHRRLTTQNRVSKISSISTLILAIINLIVITLVNVIPSLSENETCQSLGYIKYDDSWRSFLSIISDVLVTITSIISIILWQKDLITNDDYRKKSRDTNSIKRRRPSLPSPKYLTRSNSLLINSDAEDDYQMINNSSNNNNNNNNNSKKNKTDDDDKEDDKEDDGGSSSTSDVKEEKDYDHKVHSPPSRKLTGFTFIMLALSAISFPSLINAFYFIHVIAFILCLSGKLSIHKLMIRLYPFFIIVSFFHLLFIYIFQIPIFYQRYYSYLNDMYGIRNYHDWDESIWPLVIGYITVLLTYVSACVIQRKYILYNLTKPKYKSLIKSLSHDDEFLANTKQRATRFTQLALLFSRFGWSICCIEIIVVCFFLQPSIYTSVLLFFGLICTLLPTIIFKKISKAMLGYQLVFIISQYAFNIPADILVQTNTTEIIGLIIWDGSVWLYIGIQLILSFTFGLYCFYGDIKPEDYIQYQQQHHHNQQDNGKENEVHKDKDKKNDNSVLISISEEPSSSSTSEKKQVESTTTNTLRRKPKLQSFDSNSDLLSSENNNASMVSPGRSQKRVVIKTVPKKPLPPLPMSKKLPPLPLPKSPSVSQLQQQANSISSALSSPRQGGSVIMESSSSSMDPSLPSFNINIPTSIISDSWNATWDNFKQAYGDRIEKVQKVLKTTVEVCFLAIIGQSYRIALVGLFFCGLATVNLLNAGYMLFFIAFTMSETLAKKLWMVLVLYAQMVLLLLYVWQMEWTIPFENWVTQLVGITHYSGQPLWISLIWHLIIITFTLTQWNVNKLYNTNNNNNKKDDDIIGGEGVDQDQVPQIIKLLGLVASTVAQTYIALPICYMVIILVSVFAKISIISMIYMATVFLCLVIHNRSPNGAAHIRRFWGIVVLSQAAILVARYMYQFDPVYNWLNQFYPDNNYISLDDIGFEKYNTDILRFSELFGNVAIFIVCVFQLSCFFTTVDEESSKALYRQLDKFPILEKTIEFIGTMTYKHGPKVVLWTVFLVSLNNLSFFNLIYLVMIVISMSFKKGTYRIGFYILVYSQLLVLTQMAALFPKANSIGHAYQLNWVGLGQIGQNQFHLIKLNLVIILIISIQQVSYWWNKRREQQRHHLKEQRQQQSKLKEALNDSKDDIKEKLLIIDDEEEEHEDKKPQQVGAKEERGGMKDRILWYLNHFYELYGLEMAFVVISISLCWRVNILGIIYLLVIAIGLNVKREHLHRLIYVSTLMIPIILVQYIFLLGTPYEDNAFPWLLGNDLLNNLLILSSPSQYILVLDFSILFFSMLYFKQPRNPDSVPLKYPKNFLAFDEKVNFTMEPRPWYSELRYIIVRYSSQLTLIVIFIAGTSECDLVSAGYVLFSLYVLFTGNAHSRSWSALWRTMMIYNWCILIMQILFQAVFVIWGESSGSTTTILADILGFSVVKSTSFNTARETISDAVILILLAYQKTVFQSKDFQLLEQHVKHKRESAYETALEFYRERRLNRINQLDTIRNVLDQRRKRLQELKVRTANKRHSLYHDFNTHPSGILSNWSNIHPSQQPPQQQQVQVEQQKIDPNNNNVGDINKKGVRFKDDIEGSKEKEGEAAEEADQSITPAKKKRSWFKRLMMKLLSILDPLPVRKSEDDEDEGDEDHEGKGNDNIPELYSLSHLHQNNRNSVYIDPEELKAAMASYQPSSSSAQDAGEGQEQKVIKKPEIYEDDVFKRIVRGVSRIARDESKWIAFMACLANGVFNANIISLVYLFAVFLHGRLFESPRPSKGFWRFLIGFSALVLCIKYFFQIPIFCLQTNTTVTYDMFSKCWNNPQNAYIPENLVLLSTPYKIGIYKIDGHFLAGAFWDLAVFLSCLWHRHVYRSKGLWKFEEKDFQEAGFEFTYIEDEQVNQEDQDYSDNEGEEVEPDDQFIDDQDLVNQDQGNQSFGGLGSIVEEEGVGVGVGGEGQYTPVDPNNNNNSAILSTTSTTSTTTTTSRKKADKQSLLIDIQDNNEDGDVCYEYHDEDEDSSSSSSSSEENNNGDQYDSQEYTFTSPPTGASSPKFGRSLIWSILYKIRNLIISFIHFLWLVTNTSEKTGRDYYIPIFFTDFVCLIFLIIFPQNFTAIPSSDITQFLEQNVIPRQYIAILLAQFGIIILDRIIYLYKSVKAKFALQIVLTVLYHVFLFFYFPQLIAKPFDFTYSWTLVVFYILKCLYLYYSALQICYGYPILTEGRFLMDGYSDFHNIGFAIYRAIPFIFEMRTLLDWIATDTTLLFYDWLKFEDLYAQVFSVHCRQEWIKRQGRKHGQKQPIFEKFVTGVTFFVGLVLILWFPLIILSSGLPGSNIEPVTSVQMQLSITGWNPLVYINQELSLEGINGTGGVSSTFLTNTEFSQLRQNHTFIMPDEQSGTQLININSFSEQSWDMTPPARNQLLDFLTTSKLSITATYTISRSGNINMDIPGSNSVPLTAQQQQDLYNIINGTQTSFNVTGLLYKFIRLPGVSGNLVYPSNSGSQPEYLDVLFTLYNGSAEGNDYAYYDGPYWQATDLNGDQLYFYTISSKLPNGLASTLVSAGIIGLYVGVVLSVGRFLRMYVTGMALRINLENIENCEEIEKMIDDVFIARQYGDLELEEDLYYELIQVFRQSNVLYDLTKKQS